MSRQNQYDYTTRTMRTDSWAGHGRATQVIASPFEVVLDSRDESKILTAELTFVGTIPAGTIGSNWPDQEHHQYQGMLTFGDRRLVSPWLTGVGLEVHAAGHAQSFVDALVRDSTEETFDRWADEYGFDPDSLTARTTWEACVKTELNLRVLLGHPWHSRLIDVVAEWEL